MKKRAAHVNFNASRTKLGHDWRIQKPPIDDTSRNLYQAEVRHGGKGQFKIIQVIDTDTEALYRTIATSCSNYL